MEMKIQFMKACEMLIKEFKEYFTVLYVYVKRVFNFHEK